MTDAVEFTNKGSTMDNPIVPLLEPIKTAENIRRAIIDHVKPINLENLDQVYVYGAGQDARTFIRQCEQAGITVKGVLDDNVERTGEIFEGHQIRLVSSIREQDIDCPFAITTHRVTPASQNLTAAGRANFFPAWILQILLPDRFAPHMYYDNWAEDLAANKKNTSIYGICSPTMNHDGYTPRLWRSNCVSTHSL